MSWNNNDCWCTWRCRASSSSWGCELKYSLTETLTPAVRCHPLREDVSWNKFIYRRFHLCKQSSSSWGCELKLLPCVISPFSVMSSSSWGCELKYTWKSIMIVITYVILFVRMWVEIQTGWNCKNNGKVILFVRMWVEMMLDTVVLVQVAVILLVKMWVEILKSTVLIIVVAIWFFLWGGELKYPW